MSSRAANTLQKRGQLARRALGSRTLVVIGLMGAGKSVIGKMTAAAMNLPFVDSDEEIEKVSRMSISELFGQYGEPEFRALEERVIRRLMSGGPMVLSTGGGAFINDRTRAAVKEQALSIWLRADLEVLWDRVRRRSHRPLLKTQNPKETLASLLEVRYPLYAEADLAVQSRDVGKDIIVGEVLDAIARAGGNGSNAPDRGITEA